MKERTKIAKWSREVRKRDGNECKICGSKEKLHAHHLIPRKIDPDKCYDLNNGITLCICCHAKTEGYQKGHRLSEEIRKKISETKKGCLGWNKGIKMSESHRKKLSESHKGQIAWNKGKTYELPSRKGKKVSEHVRQALIEANKKTWERRKELGLPGPRQGTKTSEETRKKLSESLKKAYAEGRRTKKPMSQETKNKISETKKRKNKEVLS